MFEQDLTNLYRSLSVEKAFFEDYREKFVESFLKYFRKVSKMKLPEEKIKTLSEGLYKRLFSFKGNPLDELYSLGLKMYETELDIRAVLSKVFMVMAKDFLEYLIQEEKDILFLKSYITLVETYLETVDKASSDYVESLQEKLTKIIDEKKADETESIIDIFRVKKDNIKVIDYFYEVPVTCNSKLLRIEGRNVFLDVSRCVNKIFEKDHYVFVKIEGLSKSIKGKVEEISYDRGVLVLTDFEYAPIPQEKRKYIRVRLSEKIPIVLTRGTKEFKGLIDDISIGGVGVFLTDTQDLEEGVYVDVLFVLDGHTIDLLGQIRYLSPLGRITRAGIKFMNLTARDEEIIGEFATKRQFEILKKLRQL